MWDRSSIIDITHSFILAFCTPFFYLVPMSIVDSMVRHSPALEALPQRLSGGLPVVVQVLFAVIIIDFISYWRHRLMHCRWLWPIHAIHHSSKRLDWLSTERFRHLDHKYGAEPVVVRAGSGASGGFPAAILQLFYSCQYTSRLWCCRLRVCQPALSSLAPQQGRVGCQQELLHVFLLY